MKIIREIDGKEVSIELTNDELEKAFREREKFYHKEDVLIIMDGSYTDITFLKEFGVPKELVLARMDEIVQRKHDILSNDGALTWQDAVKMAIKEYAEELSEWEKEFYKLSGENGGFQDEEGKHYALTRPPAFTDEFAELGKCISAIVVAKDTLPDKDGFVPGFRYWWHVGDVIASEPSSDYNVQDGDYYNQ